MLIINYFGYTVSFQRRSMKIQELLSKDMRKDACKILQMSLKKDDTIDPGTTQV